MRTRQIDGTGSLHFLAFYDGKAVSKLAPSVFIIKVKKKKNLLYLPPSQMFPQIQEYENLNANFDDLTKYWFAHQFTFSKL